MKQLGIAALAAAMLHTLLLASSSARAESQQQRVALIIGNGTYHHVASLANPPNDAADLEEAFLRIGFEVSRVSNAGRSAFLQALRVFEDKASAADIAVIFYAGHGIEIDGSNYLIPVDAKLERDTDVEDEAVALTRVLQAVREAKRLRLVLLDACRANSFESRMKRGFAARAIGRGLNNLQPAGSTIVAYSAKQGTLAEDGSGRNSPFASSLLRRLQQPGLEINFLFRAIRDDVLKITNMRQEPYTYGSLGSERIYLNGDAEPSTTDEIAWNFLDRNSIKELQRFVRQFPDSRFRGAAEAAMNSAGSGSEQTDGTKYSALSSPATMQVETTGEKIEKPNQLAALSPSSEEHMRLELTVALQHELRRVGCNTTATDGDWNAASQHALELFNWHAGTRFDARGPSVDALTAVKSKAGRICPPTCEFGYRAVGNGCIKITCRAGYELAEDGSCKKPRAKAAGKPDRPKLKRESSQDAKVEGRLPKPQAAGKIFCDMQGCRPVAKGCRVETAWVAGAKSYTSQYQVCP